MATLGGPYGNFQPSKKRVKKAERTLQLFYFEKKEMLNSGYFFYVLTLVKKALQNLKLCQIHLKK